MDSSIENQLMNILIDLNKIDGVNSSLISDSNGNVICHNMSTSTDTSLFGSMANVITSSSKRLLNSTNQGLIKRVLVESKEGKALFLHLENVNFILLMEVWANVGLVMVSAKRASLGIKDLTEDLIFKEAIPEEALAPEVMDKKSELDKIIESDELDPQEIKEVVEEIAETEGIVEAFDKVVGSEKLEEIKESSEFESMDSDEAKERLKEILEIQSEHEIEESTVETKELVPLEEEVEVEIEKPTEELEIQVVKEAKEPESSIPVIKPPISFPKLPEDVKIPEYPVERANLVLDVYESIFLAMSIGASKIMGVSPARGLIKKFLPLEDCKTLLNGVDVKSNSAIDFDKIRENAENIPLEERENTLINDFSKIIYIITENYGKVMGYGAFRGIVRSEFKVIVASYGNAMKELGIASKVHPELKELFK